MKSHKLAHTGQYQCQKGCKESLKTIQLLDEHHKEKHSKSHTNIFKCEECDHTFT